MLIILWAFTLFHLISGAASVLLALRLLTAHERAHWRSPASLFAAQLMSWIYPIVAVVSVRAGWGAFNEGHHLTLPILLAPIGWLIIMGVIFAVVDLLEDGVLGNARRRG